MTDDACAALVARGDPVRWRAAMAAPEALRPRLFALYAFNLEIARAGYVASEPLLGEIRLRWWADALDEIYAGAPPRRHEVVGPLAEAIAAAGLPRAPFDAAIAARAWDCGREPFADDAARLAYVADTGGGLMRLAALALGAEAGAGETAALAGTAAGAAAFLRAAPALQALGRRPLPQDDAAARDAAAALARAGLAARAAARARPGPPAALRPALLPAATAARTLRRAAERPGLVRDGGLEPSEFETRAAALWLGLSGRW